MPHIVLNDDQARVVTAALQPVQIRDSKGNILGIIPPIWSEQDIADAKKRLASNEPRYSMQQVLDHLRTLEAQ